MRFKEYRYLILSDLYRLAGRTDARTFWLHLTRGETYKFVFWMRTSAYVESKAWRRFGILARTMFRHYRHKLGIQVPFRTAIDSGFFVGHFGGIVVNARSRIGKNCNISHGVTLGVSNRGRNKGVPVIGDNVYIGPGAKIVGGVTIGNNVAVGANCVVTRDVPDNAVVVGVPGRVISDEGSAGYVDRIDYDRHICRE